MPTMPKNSAQGGIGSQEQGEEIDAFGGGFGGIDLGQIAAVKSDHRAVDANYVCKGVHEKGG